MSCSPLGFLPGACAASPSAASPSGFCTLSGCVSMSGSSLLVYSWGWVGGFVAAPLGFLPCAVLFLRACSLHCFPCCRFPSGFQVTGCLSFCFPGAWVELSPSLLSGLLLLHWVDGAVTLLPFPYLRVRVLLAYGVSGAGYNFKALSCTAAPRAVCNTRLAALTPDL